MGTKQRPGTFDCYHAADEDEPMFVLLARDELAPERVEEWARRRFEKLAAEHGNVRLPERYDGPHKDRITQQLRKIAEALQCANNMREWRKKNRPDAA